MEGRNLTRVRLPALGLRAKIALVALVLLVIPWVGYSYVKAMESLLRENQEQQLLATARAVATTLQDRPQLMGLRAAAPVEGRPPAAGAVSEQVRILLAGLARAGLRIWVVDGKLNLVAAAGDLGAATPNRRRAAPSARSELVRRRCAPCSSGALILGRR